jgi:hypothetical protein
VGGILLLYYGLHFPWGLWRVVNLRHSEDARHGPGVVHHFGWLKLMGRRGRPWMQAVARVEVVPNPRAHTAPRARVPPPTATARRSGGISTIYGMELFSRRLSVPHCAAWAQRSAGHGPRRRDSHSAHAPMRASCSGAPPPCLLFPLFLSAPACTAAVVPWYRLLW